ncbi:hypothetical protein DID88_007273 [Monilinia fructigena]|uniref:Uncharacterized protein n=1 Tax=Monilinia fructigena TaxID=38457 RepID=A0A395J7U1_9HELO|nr:hypothetical protein DID88_007273 [Monilinia fructigena]
MLYIDQPNQVGFSYDNPTNCSLDLLTSNLYTPQQTLPNSQPANTGNGYMAHASRISWCFSTICPNNSSAMNVHLFAESYGGKYGPAFATIWEEQNAKRANGTLSQSKTIEIKLKSLGIINGCVDDMIQAPYYPDFAVNNSFGITAINPTRAKLATANFYASGGCKDLITQCRTAVQDEDATNQGNVSSVNSVCSKAYSSCLTNVMEPYYDAGRSVYDISHNLPDSFPPSTYLEYLNSADFQSAIGSPVNYTQTNLQVVSAFTSTGDYERKSYVPEIAALLNSGIHVGLIIPAYQPETAFQVFARIIMGTSLSTGETINLSVYNTTGPLNATHTTSLPSSPTNTCYLRNIQETCTENERNMIVDGKGAIIDGIFYSDSSDYSAHTITTTVSGSESARTASVTTTTEILTGLFTATATPSPSRSFCGSNGANKLCYLVITYVWRIGTLLFLYLSMIYMWAYRERHLYGWVDVLYYFYLPLERTTLYYTPGRITEKREPGIHNNPNGISMGTGDEIGLNINGGATYHRMKAAQHSSSNSRGGVIILGVASITFTSTTNCTNESGACTYAHLKFFVAIYRQRRSIHCGIFESRGSS